jgi:hypothetical protein
MILKKLTQFALLTALLTVWAQQAFAEGSVTPLFKPKVAGAPKDRVGAGIRGTDDDLPFLTVLASESTGLTTKPQPILYWSVSKPIDKPFIFTLINDEIDQDEPLLEKTITSPGDGIQAFDLGQYDVTLKPDVKYRWFLRIALDPSQPSKDPVASGTIKYLENDAKLAEKLTASKTDEKRYPFIYAEEGVWYDAIDSISKLIAQEPDNETLQQQRASLLKQVGLELKQNDSKDYVIEMSKKS